MRKNTYCVTSLKEKKTIDNDSCKSFDFGEALERVYPLLQIIFEKLPYHDLKAASTVSYLWNKYSNDELQKRNRTSWVSVSTSKEPKLVLEKSSNFKYDSTAFGLVFYDFHKISLEEFICIHAEDVTRTTFSEYLSNEIIPKDQDFWVFSCPRIYSPKLNKDCDSPVFVSVFIPEIPNINIKQFIVSCNETDNIFNGISKDEHIHCMLVFTLSHPTLIIKGFIRKLLNSEYAITTAVGGGVIVNGIKPFQKEKSVNVFTSNTLFCITLTQEKHKSAQFDAFSIVIRNDNFQEDLRTFKSRIKLREHRFAFRVCCAAKPSKDLETSFFNEIFPDTLLISIDTDGGEIGWDKFNCWEPEEDTPEIKKVKIRNYLCHHYTTVIVILTWGTRMQSTS